MVHNLNGRDLLHRVTSAKLIEADQNLIYSAILTAILTIFLYLILTITLTVLLTLPHLLIIQSCCTASRSAQDHRPNLCKGLLRKLSSVSVL